MLVSLPPSGAPQAGSGHHGKDWPGGGTNSYVKGCAGPGLLYVTGLLGLLPALSSWPRQSSRFRRDGQRAQL
jgi:hypothetical protein